MKYEKPEVINLGFAVSAIQGGKAALSQNDSDPAPVYHTTINAYEADE